MDYIILFAVVAAITVGGIFTFTKFINGEQAVILFLACFILPSAIIGISMFSKTYDTEIWNGKVTSKRSEHVSCSHSYSCNCREVCSGFGKDRSCSTTCDTCYEHSYDVDWNVYSTAGALQISRVDRQGVIEPKRWTAVIIGEPVAIEKRFTNYIKAAKSNVLNREGTKITYAMPGYPINVYDYYRIDRTVNTGVSIKDIKAWNSEISEQLKEIGPSKEVNLVLVFTKQGEEFAEQLSAHWGSGKKNDVVVVFGTQDGIKVDWAKVISWTKREDFKVALRDELVTTDLNPKATVTLITNHIKKSFDRRHMREFEYLKYDIEVDNWVLIVALLSMIVPFVVFWFVRHRSAYRPYRHNFRSSFLNRRIK